MVKSQRSFFGESISSIKADCNVREQKMISDLVSLFERCKWSDSEPMRATIDTLRAENDRLRERLAALAAMEK